MAITSASIDIGTDTQVDGDFVTTAASQSITLDWNRTPGSTGNVIVSVNGTQIRSQAPGGNGAHSTSFSYNFGGDGVYVITIQEAGGASFSAPTVIVDNGTPVFGPLTVAGNDVVDTSEEGSFSVSGHITDLSVSGQTVTVTIKDGATVVGTATGTVDSSNNFSVDFSGLTLPDGGNYTVSASVTDKTGHTGTTTEGFDSTACFLPGTMIATPEGERAIETLSIGDLVVTSEGKTAPIRWIGRNTVSLIFADKLRTLPIRVMAGALDENVPSRDLLVSPDHALLVDGVLVHAGALVNGSTIVRETNVPSVFTYFHVELEDHSLILAENTPAETFIDNIDRMAFDNWAEHEALYAGSAPLVEMDLPRAKAHRQVAQATRRRLAERAAALLPMAKTA